MPAPVPRFGGGAPAPAVAMALMSGAGASGAAGFACTTGAVPPLTMRGASAGLLVAGAAAPEDLFALGAGTSSSERVLDATGAGLFAGTVSGCEFGTRLRSWVKRQTALRSPERVDCCLASRSPEWLQRAWLASGYFPVDSRLRGILSNRNRALRRLAPRQRLQREFSCFRRSIFPRHWPHQK